MCGIAAIIKRNGEVSANSIHRMVGALRHRGPDAQRCHTLPGCHLGHSRLSIIDLSTGDQPMSDTQGRYWIVFNGEIYNYREVRQELKQHQFATQSDTEVILAAYHAWGVECLQRFRGMFAFAIWDTKRRHLFAARDLFGEKPLYYASTPDGTMVLASEMKGLISSGLFSPQLDLTMVDAYLALGYVPPHRTIYANAQVLPPGHYLDWETTQDEPKCVPYWRPDLKSTSIELDDAAERLHELLNQAVQRQLVSDVPVGAFLSGGLDSSTIVGLMQNASQGRVKTVSVGFGKYINELPFARAVAKRYSTEHYEIDLGWPQVDQLLERMIEVYDEPFADTSHIPTYLISEFARQHVKVVLTGDGGDELFGGYWWHLLLAMSERTSGSKWKWIVLRALSKLIRDRNRWLYVYSCGMGQALRWPNSWDRRRHLSGVFTRSERCKFWGTRTPEVTSYVDADYFRPAAQVTGMNAGFFYDLTSYLPGDILVKVDRAAMAHGLETRAPFLDRDLVEFALSLPPNLKVRDTESKIVLKHACERYWPAELRGRGKQGFGAPFDVWLKQPGLQSLMDRVFHRNSRLSQLLPGLPPHRHVVGGYQKWALLTLGLWLDHYPVSV